MSTFTSYGTVTARAQYHVMHAYGIPKTTRNFSPGIVYSLYNFNGVTIKGSLQLTSDHPDVKVILGRENCPVKIVPQKWRFSKNVRV